MRGSGVQVTQAAPKTLRFTKRGGSRFIETARALDVQALVHDQVARFNRRNAPPINGPRAG